MILETVMFDASFVIYFMKAFGFMLEGKEPCGNRFAQWMERQTDAAFG